MLGSFGKHFRAGQRSRASFYLQDEDKGTRRDLTPVCRDALAASIACSVLPDRWFSPTFLAPR